MNNSKVIVISGVTASGKTSLIQELTKSVSNYFVISFDDYSIDALPSAPSFDLFLKDFKLAVNQFDVTQLVADLSLALKGDYQFVFLDFPFGYENSVLKPYIDTVIYVRTPLDVTFARQIVRDYSDKDSKDIINWAKTYLDYARPIFIEHDKFVATNADYILDGTATLTKQIEELKAFHVI